MVTKWKNLNISVVVYVVSISLLISGGCAFFSEAVSQGGLKESFSALVSQDYQDTAYFRNFIASRLDDFLRMACGDYVGGAYWYNDYYMDRGTAGISEEEIYVYEAVAEQEAGDNASAEEGQAVYSEAQKRESARIFHKYIKEDKNLLYRIIYDGNDKFVNAGGKYWTQKPPEGYNFSLYFDGTKVEIQKDGKKLEIYGDGIYREGDGWYLPGFKNYPVKTKWEKARIWIFAAKEPVLYTASSYDDDGYGSENELYYIYKNWEESKRRFQKDIAFFVAGLLLFSGYFFLRKEKGEAAKKLAGFTGKIWFEWKILLFFLLPLILCIQVLQQGTVAQAIGLAVEMGMEEAANTGYVMEFSNYFLSSLTEHPAKLLWIFWLFSLFAYDLRYNKGSYKKGFIGKFAALLKKRGLNLGVSKRMTNRCCWIFFLTLGQMILSLCMLFCIFAFAEDMISYGQAQSWETGLSLAAFAVTVILLFLEYIFQKKNRKFLEGIERLAAKIESIHHGNYHDGEGIFAEDADVCKMTAELEDIRQGMEQAVEERISSERMKVELVANVSHDIKTPLTSIISYIQLLKQEEGLPGHVADYIRILEEKSERLKNMVQDVFSVSKAVSGQLSIELEELDLGKLLRQTLADMDEIVKNSPVAVKTDLPKEAVMVRADGGRMYRVFQNLIGNALKYSLEGSRVYITLKKEGQLAIASVKNTSSMELDGKKDFTERFTRGDESRTDGGSGLGLSIAKSFTEACGGTFDIETIADLFVVTVSFQALQEESI